MGFPKVFPYPRPFQGHRAVEKLLHIPRRHFPDRIGAKSCRKLISRNTRYGKENRDFRKKNVFRFIIFRARNNS